MAILLFGSYTIGHNSVTQPSQSTQSYYNAGYISGLDVGNSSGYANGYSNGLIMGNQTGYERGVNNGYSSGNSTGYQFGYSIGNITGYDLGNNIGQVAGYSQGNTSGFRIGYASGIIQGNMTGYNLGYLSGVADGAGRGYNIRDPTYQEMKNFIRTDKTNERTYNASYNCYDFTNSVCNNAFKVGYHCGFVWMDFPDIGHAITCFNTTDHSLIFIEPQYDQEVVLIIGKSYSTLNGFDAPPYNDTIVEYGIIW